MKFTVYYTVTQRFSAQVEGDGPQEALEEFWDYWHNGISPTADIEVASIGPTNLYVLDETGKRHVGHPDRTPEDM